MDSKLPSRSANLIKENRGFIVFLLLMVVFRSSFADWNQVPSGSMQPTIVEGDRILVDKLAYDLRIPLTHISLMRVSEPTRGDIVIFDSEAADNRLVKRVIGIPGDVVQLRDNRLYVNDVAATYRGACTADGSCLLREQLGESQRHIRLQTLSPSPARSFGPVLVPADHFLVLGDNRDNSADSRYIGFVPRSEIVGRSRRVALSFNPDNYYLPRAGRYFKQL